MAPVLTFILGGFSVEGELLMEGSFIPFEWEMAPNGC
jgi:hypothetical protein